MHLRIGFEISVACATPTTLILALSPHPSVAGKIIGSDQIHSQPELPFESFLDPFGNRLTRLVISPGEWTFSSDCVIEDDREPDVFDWNARQHEVAELPPATLPFLNASRYCESDLVPPEILRLFADAPPGWARVQAICNFVQNHLTYGFARSTKTAMDTLRERTGVCRDFAHLAITLCRAMDIPARYASGYLGDIDVAESGPCEFCAWFEVFLSGRWFTFDARYNTPRIGRVLMTHGRDAVDCAMITSFSDYDLRSMKIWTEEVPDITSPEALTQLLQDRPQSPALTLSPPPPPPYLSGR